MIINEGYLTGSFLVAAPGMFDDRFQKTVIFIHHHDKDGALGIVINKPSEMMSFEELCSQLNYESKDSEKKQVLYDGGPVDCNRGFVLHSADFKGRDTKEIQCGSGEKIYLTTTVDVIKKIASGSGPSGSLTALGCASWNAGQLDRELTVHGWLFYPGGAELIFDVPHMMRWETVIKKMGVDLGGLAEYTGSA